jgi:hypothetical protein
MPPRPKRARRPVIVKSVVTSTFVPPSWAPTVERIVAEAPPWPRLSVPRALMTAVCAASFSSSILNVPL